MREDFAGLAFQVWDFSVSHGELLLRSQGSGDQVDNVDIIFSGVKFLHLPTAITSPTLRDATDADVDLARTLFDWGRRGDVYVLEESGTPWFVVAKKVQVRRGFDELFETPLTPFEGFRLNQDTFERTLLARLARDLPPTIELSPQLLPDLGFDLSLRRGRVAIAVEIKLMQSVSPHRFVRNVVMSAVPALEKLPDVRGVLFVIGTGEDEVVSILKDHLLTALGKRVAYDVVRWLPEEPTDELLRRASSLLELPGRYATQ